MPNLENKQVRVSLIKRYLDADTSVAEERALALYFRHHQPDADEHEVALLLLSPFPLENTVDVEEHGEDAYDRIVKKHAKRRVRLVLWSATTAVAAIMLLVLVAVPGFQRTKDVCHQPAHMADVPRVSVLPEQPIKSRHIDVHEASEVEASQPSRALATKPRKCASPVRPEHGSWSQDARRLLDDVAQVVRLQLADAESYEVIPAGNGAFITVKLQDGNTVTYLMTVDSEDDCFQLTAMK